MTNKLFLFLISLIASYSSFASVKHVAVIVGYNKVYPDGSKKRVMPPDAYRRVLQDCGISENLGKEQLIPYEKLLCPGVLDLSQSARFQDRLQKQVHALEAKNIQKIGAIELSEIESFVSKTQFAASKWMVVLGVNDGAGTPRRAAVNFQENNLVALNLPLWEFATNPEFTDLLLMHELLGANGKKDEQYTASLALWWLARYPERISDLSRKLPNLITYRALLAEREGISVTGHGGDFAQIIFKASLLEATRKPLEISDASGSIGTSCQPSKTDIEAMILSSPMMSAPPSIFINANACAMQGSSQQRVETCGGFILHGAGNQPVIMITDIWGSYASDNQRWPLVMKVYVDIITELTKDIIARRPGCARN